MIFAIDSRTRLSVYTFSKRTTVFPWQEQFTYEKKILYSNSSRAI